jgi:MYXO-CTERM domain-containing protein
MSAVRRPLVPALLLALVFGCGAAEDPFAGRPARPLDLRASLGATATPLLGTVELVVDLFVEDGRQVELAPHLPAELGARALPAVTRTLLGGRWTRHRFELRPRTVGVLTVPALRVASQGAVATTPELTLQVTSVLPHAAGDVEAPAPPFAPPASLWPYLAAAGALLALAALAFWRRRRPRLAAAQTALPPHVTALRSLARLRHAPRRTAAEIDGFYVEVSRILRAYVEQRFGWRAPERTTEEFLAELEQGQRLDDGQRRALAGFLRRCDLVKFARLLPGETVHEETFVLAEDFVQGTRADRGAA